MTIPETAKGRGHLAEVLFSAEIMKRGYTVLWPSGDNSPFDLVVYTPEHKFFKVQVKSSRESDKKRNRNTFTVRHGGKKQSRLYGQEEIDILALYAFDKQQWTLIPYLQMGDRKTIKVSAGGHFAEFTENWNVFS